MRLEFHSQKSKDETGRARQQVRTGGVHNFFDLMSPGRKNAGTSWVQREKETLGVQVPIYRIELAIARWKELEKPTRSTSVAAKKLLAFMLILLWWSGF